VGEKQRPTERRRNERKKDRRICLAGKSNNHPKTGQHNFTQNQQQQANTRTGQDQQHRPTHENRPNEKQKQKQKLKPAPRLCLDSGTWSVMGQKQKRISPQSHHSTLCSGSDKLMKVEAFCQNDFVS
jgi:hypothetical protein